MKSDLKKSEIILLLFCAPFIFALGLIIYFFKSGILTKDVSTYYGALAMLPFFLSLFVYSIITGKTPTKGYIIEKVKSPILYYLATSFWGLVALVIFIYLIKKV